MTSTYKTLYRIVPCGTSEWKVESCTERRYTKSFFGLFPKEASITTRWSIDDCYLPSIFKSERLAEDYIDNLLSREEADKLYWEQVTKRKETISPRIYP